MGSWNQTCAVTGLPIIDGDEVEVVLLKQTDTVMDDGSHCYADSYYSPLPLTFQGKYNDYGSVEECNGVALNTIIDTLREHLVELEEGENEYHDIPAKKRNFDIDNLFALDHEARLFIHNPLKIFPDSNPRTLVRHIEIRKEVYDEIVETIGIYRAKFEPYEQYYVKLADIDRDEFTKDIDDIISNPDAIDKLMWRMDSMIGKSEAAGLLSYRGQSTYGMDRPISIIEELIKLRTEKSSDYDAFLDNALRFAMFNHFMSLSRRSWHIPSGAGSQDSDSFAQELAAKLTLSSADLIKRRWDDYEE